MSSIQREFFPALIADGVHCTAGARPRIGATSATRPRTAPPDLLRGARRCRWRRPDSAATDLARRRRHHRPDARIVAPSVVGSGVVLGRAAASAGTVGDGARIAPTRASRARSCGSGSERRRELRDCIIGADVKIGEGAAWGRDGSRVGPIVPSAPR
jgi:hypothetical protein